jgi:uncharacterized protein (DUF2141 family)
MRIFHYLYPSLLILFVASCAHIVAPTGGPKDITPPIMVRAKPDTFSIHFNTPQIRIDFDEFIQLKDEMNQIIISPPMEKPPEIKVNKKSIIIKFKEKLKDSTTYNINFGNSISDVHEGNIKEGFQYVFSTGDYVDSLSLKGKCKYAKDLKSDKGILVMLYMNLDDSIPALHKPDYFTKTDSAGNYKINNIKEGIYKLFALKDLNNNYLFDQPGEAIGYKDSPIQISGKDSADLFVFEEIKAKQYVIKSFCEEFGKLLFVFNKPLTNLNIQFLNNNQNDSSISFFEYSQERDSVLYWFTNFTQDSMKMIVRDNDKVLDTLSIYIKSKDSKRNRDKSYKFSLNINSSPGNSQLMSPENDLTLITSHPINDFDGSKFILKEDTIPIIGFKINGLDSTKRKIQIHFPWKESSTYMLSFPKGTFTDIFGLTNDTTLNFSNKIKSSKDYGNLKLKFKTPSSGSNYILQLMNDKDDIFQQNIVQGDTTITYSFLDPSKYKIKLIYDSNNNGKWDTGNYFQHLQPEKVTYCKEIFNVRANWDVEANWILVPENLYFNSR